LGELTLPVQKFKLGDEVAIFLSRPRTWLTMLDTMP
jgi:hypothetical protein